MVSGEKEMKQGYAFVRVADSDARDRAINEINKIQFNGRQISVQPARGDGAVKQREADRRKNQVQTETVFIVNFDIGTCIDDATFGGAGCEKWVRSVANACNVVFLSLIRRSHPGGRRPCLVHTLRSN